MQPTRILESSLYVTDLAAAEAFYSDVIGLTVITKAPDRHVFFRCGDGVLLLFNAEATRNQPLPGAKYPVPGHGAVGQGHLCFAATGDEIETWTSRLAEAGISIEADFQWPGEGRSIYYRDPSGNSIEIADPRIWGLV